MAEVIPMPDPRRRRIPLLFVGDAPTLPSGLGRIARDVAELTRRHIPEVRVAQLGLKYDGRKVNWHVYPLKDELRWGQGDIAGAWEDWSGEDHRGIVFTIWDPGRCPAMLFGLGSAYHERWQAAGREHPQMWGYFAIDAADHFGRLDEVITRTLGAYQRVLAYCDYGAEVLEATAGRKVPWLPHGIDTDVFKPERVAPQAIQQEWLEDGWPIVGVVATNTPRKDFGSVFAALEGVDCHLWVLTDQAVTQAWSMDVLARQYGRANFKGFHLLTEVQSDEEIARWYSISDATIAPGLGEGFGYPIVESLACGTPVVHVDYAGGREFVPAKEWLYPAAAERLEGAYGLVRPVVRPSDLQDALKRAVKWAREDPEMVAMYCRGAVAHLDWKNLWPHWERWIRNGLEGLLEEGK